MDLYQISNITTVAKSQRIRWLGYITKLSEIIAPEKLLRQKNIGRRIRLNSVQLQLIVNN